jgi:hypothetical protein
VPEPPKPSYEELAALVEGLVARVEAWEAENAELRRPVGDELDKFLDAAVEGFVRHSAALCVSASAPVGKRHPPPHRPLGVRFGIWEPRSWRSGSP